MTAYSPDGLGDHACLEVLTQALAATEGFRPGIVFYNAGVDLHRDDRLGRLALTDAGVRARDACVIGWARARRLPLTGVLGGRLRPQPGPPRRQARHPLRGGGARRAVLTRGVPLAAGSVQSAAMRAFYSKIADTYFTVATSLLLVLAVLLLLGAVWEVLAALVHADVLGLLDSVGLVIIGFAIIETSKFIAEEEILRDKELRSAVESRRSLTKFVTIIVIAASLEALVMIFKTSRTDVTESIYPAALFAATMLALVSLGAFQWLSSRIASPPDPSKGGGIDHREASETED